MSKYTLFGALTTAIMLFGVLWAFASAQHLLAGFFLGVGTYIVFVLGKLDGADQTLVYMRKGEDEKDY